MKRKEQQQHIHTHSHIHTHTNHHHHPQTIIITEKEREKMYAKQTISLLESLPWSNINIQQKKFFINRISRTCHSFCMKTTTRNIHFLLSYLGRNSDCIILIYIIQKNTTNIIQMRIRLRSCTKQCQNL